MTLNFQAIGEKIGPLTKAYTWKDVVIYALGVGAGFSDLEYCYEKDLKVIPSFAIASIFDVLARFGLKSEVNLAGILHGEQDLVFHHPIPTEGTLSTVGELTNYYDKGKEKGALVIGKTVTRHSNGKKLFTGTSTIFSRLDGGFGGENAPKTEVNFPDRDPDHAVDATPSADQPLLYRLSGDTFVLHVDPEFAKMSGFEKPIMHGLCTHGFACRALMEKLIPGRPERVRRMFCRFSKPLYPGVSIQTRIWETDEGKALWRVVNTESGEIVIDNGIFEYGEVPKDEIRFDGRVAVVTGAGGGLGRAYALELARLGAKVVVNDFGGARDGSGEGSRTPALRVVDEIRSFGGEAVANDDNVATAEGGRGIVDTALASFGRLDVLINNAGILRDKSFVKMEPENWQAVLDVHLNGACNVTRPAFKAMKENGYGRIVMTTSAAGLYGNFGQSNYSAAKLALVGFMNTLKLEGQKYDIKVNTVAPIAASRLTKDVLPPEFFEKMKPEFVTPMTLYLASDRCPVTGRIYNAGMGFFNRAAVVTGPGAVLKTGEGFPEPEDIRASLKGISSLEGGKEYFQLNDHVGDVLDAFTAPSETGVEASEAAAAGPSGYRTAFDVFEAMPDHFIADAAKGVNVVFQFSIEGAGDWYCAVDDGDLAVAPGAHDAPDCTLEIAEGDFLDMMNGRLPAMQAYTSGKLRIKGDIMKSQLVEKLFRLNA